MNRCTLLTAAVILSSVAGTAATSMAQWTSDIDANTIVAEGTGDQGTPIVVPGLNGSTWFMHTDNGAGSGYKYSLQLLDSDGVAQFPSGVVLSPTRTNSATFLVDMEVDPSGNAIAAYDNGAIYVQKVLPDGTTPWGAAGVLVPNSTNALGPRVCALADGSYAVCWGSTINLNIQRINADGTMGAATTITETGRAQQASDMLAAGGGDFIILWVRAEGTNAVTSRKGLKIQKFTAGNAQAWNAGVPMNLYTSSASPSKGLQTAYYPKMISDGAGGAIIAWYDTGAARNAWLQHVNADGTTRFAAEGIAASSVSSATEYRLSASVVYHPATQEYTVAYERSNPAQSIYGMNAQRISSEGSLLWNGGSGVAIVGDSGNHSSFINCNRAPSGDAVVTWLQYSGASGPMSVQATRLDAMGVQPWSPVTIAVASGSVNKGRLGVVESTSGDWLVAGWGHGASGAQDVRAMRINADGTVGPAAGRVCDELDFNRDGNIEPLDVDAYFSVLGEGPCLGDVGSGCNDLDFNNDGNIEPLDVDAYFSVLGEGPCL